MSNQPLEQTAIDRESSRPSANGAGYSDTHTPRTEQSYREGYVQGRAQFAREYELLANRQSSRDSGGTAGGILFGFLIASAIGGGIAGFVYFDNRLNTLTEETETITETLTEEQDAARQSAESAGSNSEGSFFDELNSNPRETPQESSGDRPNAAVVPAQPVPEVRLDSPDATNNDLGAIEQDVPSAESQ